MGTIYEMEINPNVWNHQPDISISYIYYGKLI